MDYGGLPADYFMKGSIKDKGYQQQNILISAHIAHYASNELWIIHSWLFLDFTDACAVCAQMMWQH